MGPSFDGPIFFAQKIKPLVRAALFFDLVMNRMVMHRSMMDRAMMTMMHRFATGGMMNLRHGSNRNRKQCYGSKKEFLHDKDDFKNGEQMFPFMHKCNA